MGIPFSITCSKSEKTMTPFSPKPLASSLHQKKILKKDWTNKVKLKAEDKPTTRNREMVLTVK